MTNYSVEYLDEDGNVQVMIFNKQGIVCEYQSQYFVGKDYEEPKPAQFYLCKVEGDYNGPNGATGHEFSFLGVFTGYDEDGEFEIPAYHKKWYDINWLCSIAEQIEADPEKFLDSGTLTPEEMQEQVRKKKRGKNKAK